MSAALHSIVRLMPFNWKVEQPLGTDCVRLSRVHCMSLKNPVTPPGIDPGTVRLVAQRLNHYATRGPLFSIYYCFFNLLMTLEEK
jgi:hypothetical protein